VEAPASPLSWPSLNGILPKRKELKITLMFNRIEEKIIDKEIRNLLELKVIEEVKNSDDQ
jgi:hypothetical protein